MHLDIAVGGRFHSDFLATGFLDHGWTTHLYTTLPYQAFPPIVRGAIRTRGRGELLHRIFRQTRFENALDIFKIRDFGKWAAKRILVDEKHNGAADAFIGWSSYSLEILKNCHHRRRAIFRDSSHLGHQLSLLKTEYARLGVRIPDRSSILERELEEYELADTIFVLSEYAKKTFLNHGVAEKKIRVIPLGVKTDVFQLPREARAPSTPLKVVYFGNISVRKGMPYLLEAIKGLPISMTLVGMVEPFIQPLLKGSSVTLLAPMKHPELARFLATQDVFVMPTLEDGFGQTVPQAMASGLVPIVTDACGAGELIENGKTGKIIEAGSSAKIREALTELQEPKVFQGYRARLYNFNGFPTWKTYQNKMIAWAKGP